MAKFELIPFVSLRANPQMSKDLCCFLLRLRMVYSILIILPHILDIGWINLMTIVIITTTIAVTTTIVGVIRIAMRN